MTPKGVSLSALYLISRLPLGSDNDKLIARW